jgi:hypothetical protein
MDLSFDQFTDGDILTNQIPGVSFSNAIVLSAGFSLDELEFPPRSNPNVISDNGGPLSIMFATPVSSFSGYFTYLSPLTLQGFDAGNGLIVSTTSSFGSNLALSGDPGSSPNEFLQLNSATPIADVLITGDPNGGSFVVDDISFQPAVTATPEPGSLVLLVSVIAVLLGTTAGLRRRNMEMRRGSKRS